jgi:hypothetical protein
MSCSSHLDGMVASRLNGLSGAAVSLPERATLQVRQSCRQGESDGTHDHCHRPGDARLPDPFR